MNNQRMVLRAEHAGLSKMLEVSRLVYTSLNLEEALDLILLQAARSMQAQICSLKLLNKEKRVLETKASYGLSTNYLKKETVKVGKSVVGKVVEEGRLISISDMKKDPRYRDSDLVQKEGISSLISSPLMINGEAIGAITLYFTCPHKYSREEEIFFSKVVRQAAIAIENAKLYQDLYNAYLQTISSFLTLIEAKDKYTHHHSKRVAEYAVACAKRLHLTSDEIKVLNQACYVYDLGKVDIDDNLLVKSGRLTAKEWETIKKHPLRAAEILKPLSFVSEIITVVKQHHERFDGQGYPNKEKKEAILKEARILAVADSFDAMTTDRPYRKALSKEEAIAELRRCSGKQFDPEIVKAFILALEEKK